LKTKTKEEKITKRIPYYRKPDDMTVEEWQVALRKQFAEKQNFTFKNIGDHPVFSDFNVFNPVSGNTYKVAIRSYEFGANFCSCPDFKINDLGTCKHIEYVLLKLKNNNDRIVCRFDYVKCGESILNYKVLKEISFGTGYKYYRTKLRN